MRGILRYLAAAVLFVSLISTVQPAAAATPSPQAEGFNIITSPLPIKLTTSPGQTVTTELRMKNQGDAPEGIKVGLMKFGATGTAGEPDLYNLTPTDTYANWVTFSPSQFTAQPGVWMTVTMTIKVPPTASLGYYLAVTFSRSSQPGQTDATNLKGSVATLVLLEVKTPNEKRDLKLVDFSTDHSLYEYLPANFRVTLRNTGNIYLAPTGNIFILRGSKAVETIDFNDAGGSILPGSDRLFNVPWSDGFPVYKQRLVNGKPVYDKQDKPKQDLSWNFSQASKFRFGEYTAKLLVVYDNGTTDVPLESTLTFWVIPWKILLVLLLLILLIGVGVWSVLRPFIRRARAGAGRLRKHE